VLGAETAAKLDFMAQRLHTSASCVIRASITYGMFACAAHL
jgi:hypothetical protein